MFDDWALKQQNEKPGLNLSFIVRGTKVFAHMTLSTIPRLVTYAGKFRENLELQREGASGESRIFRATQSFKPENTLTGVANVMLQTARSKFKESDIFSDSIGQRMSLSLEELVFVLFPRTANDVSLARFRAVEVSITLNHDVNSFGLPTNRHLSLSLANIAVAQLTRHPLAANTQPQKQDVAKWLESQSPAPQESVIFSLPAMDMRMISNESILTNGDKQLTYDFDSRFIRHEGQQALENISITFNLSLYSWLTDLRKTFSRDLRRAQDTVDRRQGEASSPVAARRKTLELAVLPPHKDASTLPSAPLMTSPTALEEVSPATLPSISVPSQSLPAPTTQPALAISTSVAPSLSLEIPSQRPLDIVYVARTRHIERLTVRQLGEATPDVMHPFFTKRAGFNLETSLPQYVHEYATLPVEQIMKALVKIYSKQLRINTDVNDRKG